jgi:hypothetical protein
MFQFLLVVGSVYVSITYLGFYGVLTWVMSCVVALQLNMNNMQAKEFSNDSLFTQQHGQNEPAPTIAPCQDGSSYVDNQTLFYCNRVP